MVTMALSSEEDKFLEAAVAAISRIAGLVAAMPSDDRAGALLAAERRLLQAARDYGCTEASARKWVSAIMRDLGARVKVVEALLDELDALEPLLRRVSPPKEALMAAAYAATQETGLRQASSRYSD
jgi:hypothetical protein